MNEIITGLTVVASVLLLALVVHLYQLESYQAPGYVRSVRKKAKALWHFSCLAQSRISYRR